MKENKTSIHENYINDKRLYPLTDSLSKVVLQLFVLQITNNKVKSYDILYGWCILTARPDISDEVNTSDFQKISSINGISYEVAKVSIYNYSELIIKFVNELLSGKSFKESAINCNLKVEKIKHDFSFRTAINKTCVVRPIIFNETNSNVSRNIYEKYSLHSPYGNTPSFSLSITNLDKLGVLRDSTGEYYMEYKEVLLSLLKYLSDETSMGFSTTECSRFGNIEFINTQCADIYEYPQVYFENLKKEENFDGYKEKASKQVKVTIVPNKITNSKKILVNCFSRNGGQVILDEIKECFHKEGEILEIIFDTSEPVSDLVVSAWIEDGNKWQIWFKNAAILIRSIVTNIGIVNTTGVVTSAYLEKIESSTPHLKQDVAKAKEINKASYQKMSIGDNRLDPWVSVDYNFNLFVKNLFHDKSDAAFLPHGWNVEENEHGTLAFLEWFKNICDRANHVIIQDPFFDIVGMEFIARTTNSNTAFSIITCTQIVSYDDEKKIASLFNKLKNWLGFNKPVPKTKIPNRASRIMNLLKSAPSVFSCIKLKVYDYRSISVNNKNLLHDRYILIYDNVETKGFHLSNSLQGATQNHPLLITPIPKDIIPKIEKYSIDLINEGERNNDFEVVILYDYLDKPKEEKATKNNKVINEGLLHKLKDNVFKDDEKKNDYTQIEKIIKEEINDDFNAFVQFWNTFGEFMANTPSGDEIANKIKNWILPKYGLHFKKYIIDLAISDDLNKFSNNRGIDRTGFHMLFQDDFDKALKEAFYVENYLFENFAFGNYSAGYASNVLISIDAQVFFETISIVCEEVEKRKGQDLSQKPVLKITAILFHDLSVELFWYANDDVINKCLQSQRISLRALAIVAILTDTVDNKNNMSFEKAEQYFNQLSIEESIKAYITLLQQTRNRDAEEVEFLQDKCFEKLLSLLSSKDETFVFTTVDRMIIKYFNSIEALVTRKLIRPLLENKTITLQQVHNFWKQKFEIAYEEADIIGKNNGLFDVLGWSIYASDNSAHKKFISFLDKTTKTNLNKIRKPFKKGSSEWETAFNRLLMIQTTSMIALSYGRGNESGINSTDISSIERIINEIESIKINYPFFRDYSDLHNFNKKITDKYVID